MTRKLIVAGSLALVGLALAACSNNGNKGGGGVAVTPPVVTPPLEAQFGAGFAVAYQAPANSDPRAVTAGDVIAVNATAEPVAVR